MPNNHTAQKFSIRLVCLFLCYALLMSPLMSPLTLKAFTTEPAAPGSGRVAAPPPATGPAHTSNAASKSGTSKSGTRRAGELLIRLRQGVSEQDAEVVFGSKGLRGQRMLKRQGKLRGDSGVERLALAEGENPDMVASQLRSNPLVEFVEPNFLITADQLTPNDPRFPEQWALSNTGHTSGAAGADIQAAAAWQQTTGLAKTVIAVIDSGIDFTHNDLRANRWENAKERGNSRDDDRNGFIDDLNGWDWVTGSNATGDQQGHGTAVAGIIAAAGDNHVGIAGVMWRAKLMSLRVLDGTGTGDMADAVEAIDYAVACGAQVINCSWGTPAESIALREAVKRAKRRGVVVVVSAGNSGVDLNATPYYPASFDMSNLISVASTDEFDKLALFTNWGAERVTIAAPGVEILTTKMGGDYWTVSGSSASAPLVTGIAGLVKSARPSLTAADIRAAIVDGARHIDALAGKVSSGGVASASGALASLSRPSGPSQGDDKDDDNSRDRRTPRPPDTPRRGNVNRSTPPEPGSSALAGLPNLDDIADQKSHVPEGPSATISSNLMPVCDSCYEEPPGNNDPEYSTARGRLENEIGQPGEDLGSRNFNWTTSLVSLPGRAGLDLDLSVYYNSLIWTKQGSSIQFNPDNGFPSPGFNLNFPMLQKRFFDPETGSWSYMMIAAIGARVKLKQVGTSATYESCDGSYTQLIDTTSIVRTTNGTQYEFGFAIGTGLQAERRCTRIKDRNGNYISITYHSNGRVNTVTDTLGRVITFQYENNNPAQNLTSLTQNRQGMTSTLVSFTHGELFMQPNYPGLFVRGPNNQAISVLSRITFADGSFNQFHYTPFGQVWKIAKHAPDGHLLNHIRYNLPGSDLLPVSAQTDCPRFTERRDWIQLGVMNADGEVITSFGVAPDNSWSRVTAPDGTVFKEFFETTGWRKGLTRRTETFSSDNLTTPKKWTTTAWTQDDENLPYQKNPRMTETNSYDVNGNRRRMTIEYTSFSLPLVMREWGGVNGDIPLRVTGNGYRFDAGYIDRRIIGLLSDTHVYDGQTNALVSKVIYQHDLGNEFLQFQGDATQHDPAYNTGLTWRGNVWSILRFNADVPNDWNQIVETRTGYNTNGSPIFAYDALGHQTTIGYADQFSDGVSRNTFAYPTGVNNPDSFLTTTQYKFETGAITRMQDQKGAAQRIDYDMVGRVDRVTNLVNNAYTRFIYPAHMGFVQNFTTVNSLASEVRVEQHFDGVGRVRATSSTFPGSGGGYRGTHVFYDSMGRVVLHGGPVEINSSWGITGDDVANGWSWKQQAYDWQGRPTITTRADGLTSELSYNGCGCAGGDVVTARDEHGRQRKLYKDTLGRLAKVEELNFNGSVYSTATYSYNARDQVTTLKHYQGLETSGVFQQRTLEYDGHGRLSRRTTPEQGTTEYAYRRDDAVDWVKDARGAKTVFGYNNRHLVTSINYDLSGVIPGQNVQPTPNASFEYDEVGNRTRMNDGQGWVTYHYDTLSRMDWEERHFSMIGAYPAATYRINYSYNLTGQLASITNPWGAAVTYSRDSSGQVTGIGGSGQWSTGTYAQSIQYRAWGGLKQVTYGNSRSLSVTYDNLKRIKRWDIPSVMGWEYSYSHFNENTGRVTFARNLYDSTLDRSYEYDHVGRLNWAYTGAEASAHAINGQWGTQNGPYAQAYFHDVWGNITQRIGWGGWNPSVNYSFTNNRNTALQYDLAGNVVWDGSNLSYNASGQQVSATKLGAWNIQQAFDGDTLRVKKTDGGLITYYLRSSVLGGQVIADINDSGSWMRGYVYDWGGQLLALQQPGGNRWVYQDPVTKSKRITDTIGGIAAVTDLDPWGGETSRTVNGSVLSRKYTTYDRNSNGRDEAMMRSYHAWFSRFDQPDPYDGSYDLADPQSFNRYTYTQNDPVNFSDPSGLLMSGFCGAEFSFSDCGGWGGIFGGYFGGDYARYQRMFEGIPQHAREAYAQYQLQREIDDFFNRLPADAVYVGDLTWGYSRWQGDALVSYSVTFSVSRGLDTYFSVFAGGFVVGNTLTDLYGNHQEYNIAEAVEAARRNWGGGGAGGSIDDDSGLIIFRSGTPSPSNLTPRPGDNGLLSFSSQLANPPAPWPPVFAPGKPYIGIDVGRLPAGSVIFDGGRNGNHPNHVSVIFSMVSVEMLKNAVVVRGTFPR
jgi:RHS repeat-associated protein